MNLERIPQSLKSLQQWVCYRTTDRGNGKLAKIPVDPKTLKDAKANDPSTWATFEEAVAAAARHGLAGVGIEFASGVCGVDLDGVISGGQITPEAADIVETMDSYTEYSPSGTGLHILFMGKLPQGRRRKGAVEMYDAGRFFTVTGETYGAPRELQERTQEAARVHARYIEPQEPKQAQESPRAPQRAQESDADIISKMFSSRRGPEIRKLWAGDLSSYGGDHSRADQALINDLAYWTNGDAGRMDQLFRQSGLMRDKWDRRDGNYGTYGNRTIQTALVSFQPYTGPAPYTMEQARRDFDDLDAPASPPVGSQPPAEPPADPLEGLVTAADYLRNNFNADRQQFKGYRQRRTGFENIDDKAGGLYPGLYVLGALSSLGKTTFAHQLADQLAAAGDTVLFFSLEQSVFELTTKSLARESFKLASDDARAKGEEQQSNAAAAGALSAIELRAGKSSELMGRAQGKYLQYAGRVIVKECNFKETAESMAQTVAAFIEKTGITPIVMVDYLQIIPAENPRMTDKEKTDQNMRRLKILQRDHDLVLFVISALNRANYLTPISFESFRESSGIEYTADVVWGMQYAIITTDPIFNDPTKKIGEKRKKLQEAKAHTPRAIELVCLKNRYGRDYTARFHYFPKYDYFLPGVNDEDMALRDPAAQGTREQTAAAITAYKDFFQDP